MYRSFSRVSVCIAIAISIFATSSEAHADRRQSLNGNVLISDQDDLFVYPQLLTTYDDRLRLDYGASSQAGSGFVAWRQGGLVFGVALSRGTLLDPQISELGEESALSTPYLPLIELGVGDEVVPGYVGVTDTLTAVDAMLAVGDFGLRLGLGGGGSVVDPESGGAAGSRHTFVSAGAGYRFANSDAFRVDTGANLFLDLAAQLEDGDRVLSGNLFGLRLDGRAFWAISETIDWGSFAEFDVMRQAAVATREPGDPAAVGIRYDFTVGAGPVLDLPRETSLGVYVQSGIEYTGADPNSEGVDDQVTQSLILFPGVRAAVETALVRWLYLRSGMRYDFLLNALRVDGGGTTNSRVGIFDWDVGLGFDLGAVDIDATFSPAVITSGTYLLSGSPQAPFAIVSLSLDFDELREFSAQPTESEPSEVAEEDQVAEEEEEPSTTDGADVPQEAIASSANEGEQRVSSSEFDRSTAAEAHEPVGQTEPSMARANPDATALEPTRPDDAPRPVMHPPARTEPGDEAPAVVEAPSSPSETPFQPVTFDFLEEGRVRVDDGTTSGTHATGWSLWYEGEPWGTGHRVRARGGEQTISVVEGSFGLTRNVGNAGGRTLRIQHRFSGTGFYEVIANDQTVVRYEEPTYEVETFQLPPGTTSITLKVGSLEPEQRAAATINKIEIF